MHKTGTIYGINGPVIYLKGNTGFQMAEMVYVGKERLVGEVIRLTNDITTIQVFEETTGLRPGDPVEATGDAISVTLGPGILNNIFDGIERPLSEIAKSSGKYISRGVSVDSLDTEKKWQTHITVKPGEFVSGGTIIAEVQETQAIVHKSMVPPNISGTVLEVAMDGEYTINEPIVTVQLANGKEEKLTLAQKWPIRVPRPTAARFAASKPLITGQRILDTLFPIAKGGTAAIPGGFGTGKTMTQHQIAKWSNADKGEKMARFSFLDYSSHAITNGSDSQGVAYILLQDQRDGKKYWGVGLSHNINLAPLRAILSAINRAKRSRHS